MITFNEALNWLQPGNETFDHLVSGNTQDFIPNSFIQRVLNSISFLINASLSFNAGHSQFAPKQVNITFVS